MSQKKSKAKAKEEKAKAQAEAQAKAKQSSAKKRIAIIVGAIVVVIAIIVGVAFAFVNAGKHNLLQPDGYDASSIEVYSGASSGDGGHTVVYNGKTYKLNENVVPICIMGNDKGLHTPDAGTNGQADAIMVIAIDTETNDIKGISVPRDSMVKSLKKFRDIYNGSSYKTDKMQICLTYACGNNDDQSAEYVADAASELLSGIPINFYYTLWTDGLGELADIAGGVTLEALYTLPAVNTDKIQSSMPIVAGETVTLKGDDALRYVQYRDTSRYETALERLERQRQFVKELAKTLLERVKGNPSVAVDIFNTLQEYSNTNLGAAEFSYLASLVAASDTTELELTKLEGTAVHNSDNPWEQYLVDEASAYQVVLDTFYTPVD